jgi:hypothetical protein
MRELSVRTSLADPEEKDVNVDLDRIDLWITKAHLQEGQDIPRCDGETAWRQKRK